MINLEQELKNYPLIDLKSIDENAADNVRNSAVLYNKAIESIKAGSEDIAIIELKKAMALNPAFYQAINLLGLCYSLTKDFDKAADAFSKVLKAENNSIQAQKYLSQLNSEDKPAASQGSKKKAVEKKESVNTNKNQLKGFLGKLGKNGPTGYIVLGLVAGILLTAIAGYLIFGGSKDDKSLPTYTASDTNKKLQADYDKLQNDFNTQKQNLDTANSQIDYYKNVLKLYNAESLSAKGQYEASADILIILKDVKFTGTDKTKFDGLNKYVMPKASDLVYNKAFTFEYSQKYQDAVNEFNKIQLYGNWPKMDIVLYNLGKCYAALNDKANAIDTYKKLQAGYPKSQYATWAGYRINELTAQ
ncbi:MAG: tetratricopeptide repeat protein [Bacillota bacterium]|nr:tetratricopeptide repeat protein [Bacillota bacterium]